MNRPLIGLLVLAVPVVAVLLLFLYDNRGRYGLRTLLVIMTWLVILATLCSLALR